MGRFGLFPQHAHLRPLPPSLTTHVSSHQNAISILGFHHVSLVLDRPGDPGHGQQGRKRLKILERKRRSFPLPSCHVPSRCNRPKSVFPATGRTCSKTWTGCVVTGTPFLFPAYCGGPGEPFAFNLRRPCSFCNRTSVIMTTAFPSCLPCQNFLPASRSLSVHRKLK